MSLGTCECGEPIRDCILHRLLTPDSARGKGSEEPLPSPQPQPTPPLEEDGAGALVEVSEASTQRRARFHRQLTQESQHPSPPQSPLPPFPRSTVERSFGQSTMEQGGGSPAPPETVLSPSRSSRIRLAPLAVPNPRPPQAPEVVTAVMPITTYDFDTGSDSPPVSSAPSFRARPTTTGRLRLGRSQTMAGGMGGSTLSGGIGGGSPSRRVSGAGPSPLRQHGGCSRRWGADGGSSSSPARARAGTEGTSSTLSKSQPSGSGNGPPSPRSRLVLSPLPQRGRTRVSAMKARGDGLVSSSIDYASLALRDAEDEDPDDGGSGSGGGAFVRGGHNLLAMDSLRVQFQIQQPVALRAISPSLLDPIMHPFFEQSAGRSFQIPLHVPMQAYLKGLYVPPTAGTQILDSTSRNR